MSAKEEQCNNAEETKDFPTPTQASSDREKLYTSLLKYTIKDCSSVHALKIVYFSVILALLIAVSLGSLAAIICVTKMDNSSSSQTISVVAGAFTSFLSSIIIIPKIMAKHIFPEDSEKERYKFVNGMKLIDQANLHYYSKELLNSEDNCTFETTPPSDDSTGE